LVAVAMMGVLLALTIGGVYVGSAVIARHRAQAAADLAALAAAGYLAEGTDVACTQAAAVAHAMQTVVTRCTVEDLDVVVAVDAPVSFGRMGAGPARAAARAGPVRVGR
jgi:secretion/DNA translocation related TadE-like protein